MGKIRFIAGIGVLLLAGLVLPVFGQEGAPEALPEPLRVELEASDGLLLIGHYYAPVVAEDSAADTGSPGVLLMHQMGMSKESWDELLSPLVDAGYGVLAVDLRAHGETGGAADWILAQDDVRLWLSWLGERDGIDPARLNIVGASIGANLALRGMAEEEAVVTVVALSPGLDYRAVTTEDAVETIGARPLYLVSGQADSYSAQTVKTLGLVAAGDALLRLYPTGAHGVMIFPQEAELVPSIVNWLERQNR